MSSWIGRHIHRHTRTHTRKQAHALPKTHTHTLNRKRGRPRPHTRSSQSHHFLKPTVFQTISRPVQCLSPFRSSLSPLLYFTTPPFLHSSHSLTLLFSTCHFYHTSLSLTDISILVSLAYGVTLLRECSRQYASTYPIILPC